MNGDLKRLVNLQLNPLSTWYKNTKRLIHEVIWLSKRKKQIAGYFQNGGYKKLNIGCGANQLAGWLNADFFPTRPDVVFLDASQSFQFKSDSFDYVFSEHMIEHIPFDQAMGMLKESYRILKPGGKIRIATPDLNKIVSLFSATKTDDQRKYIEWIISNFSNSENMRIYHETFVLNQVVRGWGHQFIYDEAALAQALEKTGFKECKYHCAGESNDAEFKGIESHGHFINELNVNAYETLVVEAVKH